MEQYFELGLTSYDVISSGEIIVVFSDGLSFMYANEGMLDFACTDYDAEVIENLRKYIVCYCANYGGDLLEGKKLVFDLAEPNGNIVRIV